MNEENLSTIRNLKQIKIETSRRCPMANIHTKCPVTTLNKEFDDSLNCSTLFEFIRKIVDYGCTADILLYLYNEPSADCKLSYIIHYIRDHLNIKNKIMFDSNGFGLDEQTLKMLFKIGLTRAVITGYEKDVYDKFAKIKDKFCQDTSFNPRSMKLRSVDDENGIMKDHSVDMPYTCYHMDSRLSFYDRLDGKPRKVDISSFSCIKLNNLLCVSATGEVSLCEYDWKPSVSFGNLYKDSLEDIITSKTKFNERAYKESILPDICSVICSQAFHMDYWKNKAKK